MSLNFDGNWGPVERFSSGRGQADKQIPLPEGTTIILVRIDENYFEMFLGEEQVGAFHRNADFITEAAKFHAQKESAE